MTPAIALVGMACRYPDARSPAELWENVLAQRRAFRRLPPERLCLEDYLAEDREAPDTTYSSAAALIEGYEFDRVRFRVAGSTFRAVDMAHWLALEVAADALADAGFTEGEGLPKDASGVLVGNSLTGEFSRANLMRLRWPYVRRVIDVALSERDWSVEERSRFLDDLEQRYKSPFPPVGDETLAGGLSNTIAGRICNHFDLGGGGYTVDGACSSSLLALATACSALTAGDLDVAVAGGVDLSLDPFELVGFAKIGALAADEMRVYDARSTGFWPGEGCGFLVLMRHEDALRQHRRAYAIVRGWGISSDGSGGITRPEVEGQLLALRRAYRRAGFGIETVSYFEGHGTGTGVGDPVELRALSRACRERVRHGPPAVIGSIKANIGHTKAAAGLAGLIKATMALRNQVLPPGTGWEQPHTVLSEEDHVLRLLREGAIWPADQPLRAGVSAMGFGGVNAHVVLEGVAAQRRRTISSWERTCLSTPQDAELFLLGARDTEGLLRQVKHLLSFVSRISRSELTDLAAQLAQTLCLGKVRAAAIASSPTELEDDLKTLGSWLSGGAESRQDACGGVMLGSGMKRPAIGFLFPGQGSPANLGGGAWARRFEHVRDLYARARLPSRSDGVATEVAQPAIVTASLAGLHVLYQLGIAGAYSVGHSLGELTAYHWAEAIDEDALLRLVTARSRVIAEFASPDGAMASIAAGQEVVDQLLTDQPVVVAGLNSPTQTVVSGKAAAVEAVVFRAQAMGLTSVRLAVSHAFHSPLVAQSKSALALAVAREEFRPPRSSVVSTVTGALLQRDEDLGSLLLRQITSPVRFVEALRAVADRVDLWIEVGPGNVLSRIAGNLTETPIASLDSGGASLRTLLQAVGAAFTLGAAVDHRALYEGRFTRPFDLDWQPRFFINPCELAPKSEAVHSSKRPKTEKRASDAKAVDSSPKSAGVSALDVVRQLAAKQAELPLAIVTEHDRLLGDLHLSSLAVGQLVVEAARTLGLPPPASPAHAANATVAQVAEALEQLVRDGQSSPVRAEEAAPAGVDSWTRTFTVELVERHLPRTRPATIAGSWRVIGSPDHPMKSALQQALDKAGQGRGVAVCLPPDPDERHVDLLLGAARAALAEETGSRFLMVQHGGGGAAFARTLHLEMPETTTCVVDVPLDHPQATAWVLAESQAASGYAEAHYDDAGTRREAVLRWLPAPDKTPPLPICSDDVMLVTGGGKGIAAESALSLAKETGVRLALLGRSQPSQDAELAANLERMKAAGVQCRYFSADVGNRQAVQATVREVEACLGPITAVLHGAGNNVPQRLDLLDEEAFLRTLRPKVQGARNVLAAVDPKSLRLLVTFGSIIARTGMRGQADYAVANEWLTRLSERWQAEHPHCRCLAVEWSVWSGVGMGERLGTMETLKQQGITSIPLDEGVRQLRCLIGRCLPSVSVVVTGRFGDPPTLRLQRPELPLLRFLERPRVYVPGVELVVEADLSTDTDPYLKDHVYQGLPLLPAVMGLEAMAQATVALAGSSEPPVFENVEFLQPIVVPNGQRVTILVAALARTSGRVDVVLRSQETGFQRDHFRATCRVAQSLEGAGRRTVLFSDLDAENAAVPLNPQRDLYGGILFHKGRFQRLKGYRRLKATECIAEITCDVATTWFGQYLPARLVLGDAAARDAAIHAVQACIPQGTLLPIGVDRLIPAAGAKTPLVVSARERSREGDVFVYDLEVTDTDGILQERWEGLRLRLVSQANPDHTWVEALLGPYIERRVRELIPGSAASVVVERSGAAQRSRRADDAIRRAVDTIAAVCERPDRKPEVGRDKDVSVSHARELVVAVAGPKPVACDTEPLTSRPNDVWRDLLGPERYPLMELIAGRVPEDGNTAATRVWAASKCLEKAGVSLDVPLVLHSTTADAWVLLATGALIIATWVAPVRESEEERIVVAILSETVPRAYDLRATESPLLATNKQLS